LWIRRKLFLPSKTLKFQSDNTKSNVSLLLFRRLPLLPVEGNFWPSSQFHSSRFPKVFISHIKNFTRKGLLEVILVCMSLLSVPQLIGSWVDTWCTLRNLPQGKIPSSKMKHSSADILHQVSISGGSWND
jgi:hypothetical protein